jgi:hypothetical protein
MQKISSYLYPIRINVIADVTLFPTRWNIVYQNKIKIYKGVNNVITLDIKNADQKRIDISEMQLSMSITDVAGQHIYTADAVASNIQGLAVVTVPSSEISHLDAQFLSYTVYNTGENDVKNLLYTDSYFGAVGSMELVGSAVAVETAARYITRFTTTSDNRLGAGSEIIYYNSDAVEIRQPNFITTPDLESVEFEILFNSLAAEVTIQFTRDTVISNGTNWTDIEKFSVVASTTSVSKVYSVPAYNREYSWARIVYVRASNNTGNIDKAIIRL